MKNGASRRQRIKTLLLALGGVLCATLCASAGQEQYDINLQELRNPSYDIDLRELRRTPARRARAGRKHRAPRRARSTPPAAVQPEPPAAAGVSRTGSLPPGTPETGPVQPQAAPANIQPHSPVLPLAPRVEPQAPPAGPPAAPKSP